MGLTKAAATPLPPPPPRNGDVAAAPPPPPEPPAGPAPAEVEKPRAPTWTPDGDTYENHEPRRGPVGRAFDKLLNIVAPIRTHERVVGEFKTTIFGIEAGVTFSQLELVKKGTKGIEVVHVVGNDGSSNWEMIWNRWFLGLNHRIELQGFALNTSRTPGESPVGFRLLGLGLTSDKTSAMDHDAISYTAEVKITEKFLPQLAASVGAGTSAEIASNIAGVLGGQAASVVGDIVMGVVPFVSIGLAAGSAKRAWHVCHDKTASKEMKIFAVAHAIADGVRVVHPLAGTLMNVGLVGVAALLGWTHHRYAKHAPPTGPPPEPPPKDIEGP